MIYQVFVFGVARPKYNLGQLDYQTQYSATLEGFEMRIIGTYPVIGRTRGRGKVVGDLVEVDAEAFVFIKEWEGQRGEEEEVVVTVEGGKKREAITFVSSIESMALARSVPSGDWLDTW